MQELVSIITPACNSGKYLEATIRSVQSQTWENWEMLIVDDASTDDTAAIALAFSAEDPRIRVIRLAENGGAAVARNRALEACSGRFVAYLDADDLWKPEKLQKQVAFMLQNHAAFSCTSYEVIADDGTPLNKVIHMLPRLDYRGFLTHNLLQTAGIMVDASKVRREDMVMPDFRRRQDAATWLQILKAGHVCYGMPEVLACYRRSTASLSSNKWKAAMGVWTLYRKVEKLPLIFSCYCFARYAMLAVWKRIYPRRRG